MSTFGERLRQERMRVGLSQEELAAVGGLQKKAQMNYESGARSPDANYLMALLQVGVDIVYVITGEAAFRTLPADESELLGGYRLLNVPSKAAVRSLVQTCLESSTLTASGEPVPPQERRVKRLASNRVAALDQQAADTVRKAMEVVGEYRIKQPRGKAPSKHQKDSE
ncbi:helix-turn-helix domain-containing protein [Paraburkholderia sp. SIMBA_030]|uniref:helix-turn-helix domain-containing protein n=1 Tax=Paraburkholderia sp. SIMBA_030 TaxID=3085773 RepID=UPI00397B12A2